jgi:hypothetical protein
MSREKILLRRVRLLTWVFIIGLVASGATAIPLRKELALLAHALGVAGKSSDQVSSGLVVWILKVREGLENTGRNYPFMAYGTDWLAFGHFVIAVAFIGALRDPVRNKWLFTFGMIACAMIPPYAFICGAMRGIPVYWRLIDCSFGVFGFIPVWLCYKWVGEIEALTKHPT